MKVAVISDIHGNMRALEATLEDIARQRVDRLVCAGDVPNPFLRSLDAWLLLKSKGIPLLRGNHEDYIVSYFSGDRPEIREAAQFRPIQLVARHMGEAVARELAALPFDHVVSGPNGDDLYICHASPLHNARSYIFGIDPAMASSLERIAARTVVAGHIHRQWSGQWQGKNLLVAGSVGLPHHGKPEAEYALFTHTGGSHGGWRWELRTVPYDAQGAIQEYADSGALEQGGPIAWMLYDELLCAEPRLAYFIPFALRQLPRPASDQDWARLAVTYLEDIGRWDALKKRCPTTI